MAAAYRGIRVAQRLTSTLKKSTKATQYFGLVLCTHGHIYLPTYLTTYLHAYIHTYVRTYDIVIGDILCDAIDIVK